MNPIKGHMQLFLNLPLRRYNNQGLNVSVCYTGETGTES